MDFSKAFDSVWPPARFHILISDGLFPCFARWAQSFLSDGCACVVFQNHKWCSFWSPRGVSQRCALGPVGYCLFMNDLPAYLPSFVSCYFYAENHPICFFSHSVSDALWNTQGAQIWLERWSERWCLPLNSRKCQVSFFSVDPDQANLHPHLCLFNLPFDFIPTPTVLGVTLDRIFSFSKHVSSMEAKFFPRLKVLQWISASPCGFSKKFSSLCCTKLFFGPFRLCFTWIVFFPKRYQFYQIETASRAITGCFSSSRIPLLLPEASISLLRVTRTNFFQSVYEWAFVSQSLFPF